MMFLLIITGLLFCLFSVVYLLFFYKDCVTNCDGKKCGDDDGCNGSCTQCQTGYSCQNNKCEKNTNNKDCVTNCDGKKCGDDDGCNGSCTQCQTGYSCQNNKCEKNTNNKDCVCPSSFKCENNNECTLKTPYYHAKIDIEDEDIEVYIPGDFNTIINNSYFEVYQKTINKLNNNICHALLYYSLKYYGNSWNIQAYRPQPGEPNDQVIKCTDSNLNNSSILELGGKWVGYLDIKKYYNDPGALKSFQIDRGTANTRYINYSLIN